MNVFYTSDTHFGHKNIIDFCKRPFQDVSHMNEILIKNWNETVSPDDTVFHLGDVALGPWVEWDSILSRLNGYKILIVGNHDRIFAGEKERQRERFRPFYEQWFDEIHDEIRLGHRNFDFGGHDDVEVIMSHFPYDGDSHDGDRYTEHRPVDNGSPLIHGHTHSSGNPVSVSKRGTPQFHVGVDAHGYRPVHEEVIVEWLTSF